MKNGSLLLYIITFFKRSITSFCIIILILKQNWLGFAVGCCWDIIGSKINIPMKLFFKYGNPYKYKRHKNICFLSVFYLSTNMKLGTCVKNYFTMTSIENWDYELFSNFMKIIWYGNEDCITRVYVRYLKDFIKEKNPDGYEKDIIFGLLKSMGIKVNNIQTENSYINNFMMIT